MRFGTISGIGSKGWSPEEPRGKRGPRTNNRLFLDALLWMARSGGRWRDLPERLGNQSSALAVLAREADLE